MRGKRIGSFLLAMTLALSLLPIQVMAEDELYTCKLVKTGTSATLTHYIEYVYNGKTYYSDSTGALMNYTAWKKMSDVDKRKVTKWFAGFNSQMEAQFSGASEMREFAMDGSGWKQAGEALRDRLASTYYPDLKSFYEDGEGAGMYQLDSSVRAKLTPTELEAYDEAANTYGIAYSMGLDAYQTLLTLKQKQINAAVTSISSGLIDLIMKYSMPPRPGEVLSTLEDTLEGYIKDSIGIENRIKDIVGLNKLTGEADRIEADKAAEVINIFWDLMAVQQNMAFRCMMKCKQQQSTLERLGASCVSTATRRTEEAAAAEANRQKKYEEAVAAGVAQSDIDPDISVTRETNETQESYDARRLSAAKSWASNEFSSADDALGQLWRGGYSPQLNPPAAGSALYYDHDAWTEWSNNSKLFYTRCFVKYLNMLRRAANPDAESETLTAEQLAEEDRYYLNGCEPILLKRPEELFKYHTDYEEWLGAINEGYEAVDKALAGIESKLNAYIAAWEKHAGDFRTAAQPYRNRAYNLTADFCTFADDGYGNWGVEKARWERFQSGYEQLCDALHEKCESAYDTLESVRAARRSGARCKAEYEQDREKFEETLPQLYELYAYSQDELDYSLYLAMQSIEKLEALQNSYPDWLKNAKTGAAPIAGGQVAARDGRTNDALETTVFKGIGSVPERYRIMEEELVPALRDYQKRENDLLAQLDKAQRLFKEAVGKREDNDRAMWGQSAELANLNALHLGSMTIRNHVDMMNSFGFYDYYYKLNGKTMPKKTAAIAPLLADLSGDSPYMVRIRELHAELLEKKGDYMRMARAGTLLTTPYANGVTWHDHFAKNGNDSSYTIGYYGDACFRSYTSSDVYNYWYENISPIIRELEDIVYHNVDYIPVTGLSKSGPQARLSESGAPGRIFAALLLSSASPELTLELGESSALHAAVEPANATYPELVWSSSDESIAAVDEHGVVTGLLPGDVTITATAADSPSGARITASFSVRVMCEGVASLAELGDGYYLLAPKLELSGGRLNVSGTLGTNGKATQTMTTDENTEIELGSGNEFLAATAIFAAYDGARFLGCATEECVCYRGELCDLSVTIDLAAQPAGMPKVRLFLLDRGSFAPAMGYTPLTL